jgi:biotin/methionine sulfoxide reductase
MLPKPQDPIVVTHWGTYRAVVRAGKPERLVPLASDPDPSPIAQGMIDALDNSARILRPAVRKSFLVHGPAAGGSGRGKDPFVEVSWREALDLAARELERIRTNYGAGAIYGGSYGWGSAGRFHHAQSQIHRFLNVTGGYTRSIQNYSFAAADIILPHVVGDSKGVGFHHTTWQDIVAHTKMLVIFGGLPSKNAQVNSGGIHRHILREALANIRANGAELVSISPLRDDVDSDLQGAWLPIRPTTDVAMMLGIAFVLASEGLHDRSFLNRYTSGYDRFEAYLLGRTDGTPKTPEWAEAICQVPAESIRGLARRMARTRTMIMMSWALQRADHGEQPYWMAITLAAMLGQIGLPGGGYGFGYGSVNSIGNPAMDFSWPSLPQGENTISDFIPVARVADMLLNPGGRYDFNGERRTYPDIRLVYWAGGNPFHHHQDINRLRLAWQRPEAVIVHESWWNATARHADIVFPIATTLERNDIGCSGRDNFIAPSHKLTDPAGEARNDYDVFTELARRAGAEDAFTEGRDEEGWLRHLYDQVCEQTARLGHNMPDFDTFWRGGLITIRESARQPRLLEDFRRDPQAHPLKTPSGKIEIHSPRIETFAYDDCPGHPTWLEPYEWLGSPLARQYPLHLVSNQPKTRLHSQYDSGSHSRASKIHGREAMRMHPSDAKARGISDGDIVRVFNDRGECLAGIILSEELLPGVIQLPTGAWYDPADPANEGSLEKHGNPNVLTRDKGTSRLGQGPSAHSCLVEVERFTGTVAAVTAFDRPAMAAAE